MLNLSRATSGIAMRLFMSLLWISVSAGLIINDFNATHLLNQDWPPHARLHMMTLFTSTVAFTLFGLYLCWGPAQSRLEHVRLSAIAGSLYMYGLVLAALTMPYYGGSMESTDTAPQSVSLDNENFVVFLCFAAIFTVLTITTHLNLSDTRR